jgi:hypothetical protein
MKDERATCDAARAQVAEWANIPASAVRTQVDYLRAHFRGIVAAVGNEHVSVFALRSDPPTVVTLDRYGVDSPPVGSEVLATTYGHKTYLTLVQAHETNVYAAGGSRETPKPICDIMTRGASLLREAGFTVRVGDGRGADAAFRLGGLDRVEVFTPGFRVAHNGEAQLDQDRRDEAFAIAAAVYHSDLRRVDDVTREMHVRAVAATYGPTLDSMPTFVVTYGEEGDFDHRADGTSYRTLRGDARTMHQLAIAAQLTVYNLADERDRSFFLSAVDMVRQQIRVAAKADLAASLATPVAAEPRELDPADRECARLESVLRDVISSSVEFRPVPLRRSTPAVVVELSPTNLPASQRAVALRHASLNRVAYVLPLKDLGPVGELERGTQLHLKRTPEHGISCAPSGAETVRNRTEQVRSTA